mgnify:CR=1 FL=1
MFNTTRSLCLMGCLTFAITASSGAYAEKTLFKQDDPAGTNWELLKNDDAVALKKDGKPLYEYARAGEEVEIKQRAVRIDTFEITKIDLPDIHFRIACTKGTYIRSIAHDFGKAMHTGSYLSALRRTKIGNYNVHDATLVTDWEV